MKYSKNNLIITKASGELKNIFGKANEFGQLGGIDPGCNVFCLHFLQGIVKIVPMVSSGQRELTFKEPFNIRMAELNVIAMCFLHDKSTPLIGILWQDMQKQRKFKTYEIDFKREEFVDAGCTLNDCDPTASILQAVPLPLGGVLIVGKRLILYKSFKGENAVALEIPEISFKCITRIDPKGIRWLLGDEVGQLFLCSLVLDSVNQNTVISIGLELLGTTVIASCLTYIDKGILFVGSICGDHQLVQLLKSRNENGSMVEIIESYQNLAPIHDFKIVNLDNLNQSQIVACCGSGKEGSLKIIRSGITFAPQTSIELASFFIKRIWYLSTSSKASFLLVSSPQETKALILDGDFAEEILFIPNCQETLFACNLDKDTFVHISHFHIRILVYFGNQFVVKREWKSPNKILLAIFHSNRIAIYTGKSGIVLLFEISNEKEIVEKQKFTAENEVSSLTINSNVLVISYWNSDEISIYQIPEMTLLVKVPTLNTNCTCHSIETTSVNGLDVVYLGYDDGKIQLLVLEQNVLIESTLINAGTQPVSLKKHPLSADSVIVCSDKPLLISYKSTGNLEYKRINFKNLVDLTATKNNNTDSLWICDKNTISFCTFESQKMTVVSVPLNATLKRLAHDKTSGVFVILLYCESTGNSFVKVFDSATFHETFSASLDSGEYGQSIECIQLNGRTFFAIGTGIRQGDSEEEPSLGKIKLYRIVGEKKLEFVCDLSLPGCIYSIAQFNDELFAATCRDSVALYKLDQENPNVPLQLVQVCTRKGYVVALRVKCKGDFLLIGDLLRSVSLLFYNSELKQLEEKARDFNVNTIFSLDYLSSDLFVASDDFCNLITLSRHPEPCDSLQRKRLLSQGHYHVGDLINSFEHGNLSDNSHRSSHTILSYDPLWYCTISGSFGFILPLSPTHYDILSKLQSIIKSFITPVGNLPHSQFRTFLNERRSVESENMIDGNLINLFNSSFDLTIQKQILTKLNETTEWSGGMKTSEVKSFLEDLLQII